MLVSASAAYNRIGSAELHWQSQWHPQAVSLLQIQCWQNAPWTDRRVVDQLSLDILQHFVSKYGTSVQEISASRRAQVVVATAVHSASMRSGKKSDLLAHGVRM